MPRVLAILTAFLILTSAFLLFALPKFPLIDTLLMRRGVFLVFEEVREDVFSVKLKKAKVLLRGEELLRFEELEFGVGLSGPYSRGRCGEGVLLLAVGWLSRVRTFGFETMLKPVPVSKREKRRTRSGKKRSTPPIVTLLPTSEKTPSRKLPERKALYMSVRSYRRTPHPPPSHRGPAT